MRGFAVILVYIISQCVILNAQKIYADGENSQNDDDSQVCTPLSFGHFLSDEFSSLRRRIDELQGRFDHHERSLQFIYRWLFAKEGIVDTDGVILNSCKEYINSDKANGDGWYFIQTTDDNIDPVYCDQTSLGGGWMRLYYKDGSSTCNSYPNIQWTESLFGGLRFQDFAVSDSIETLNREKSWIILNYRNSSRLPSDMSFTDGLVNLGNCLTPSGTQWSTDYTGGYVYFGGKLSTMGGWTTMHYGCHGSKTVGDDISFRAGGGTSHSGEFIHSSCNDYHIGMDNAITSKWYSNNRRSIWLR